MHAEEIMNEGNKKNTRLIFLTFSVMIVLGFMMNLRGVLIPSIKEEFGVSYSDIGTMFFIADLGYMVATFFGGVLGQKVGLKRVLVFGFAITIVGIVGLNFANSFVILILLLFLITAGTGCFDICANSLGARIFIANAAIMMNLLHGFFGVGSIVSPKYAGWLLSANMPWTSTYTYSLVLVGAVLLFVIFTRFPKRDEHEEVKSASVRSFIKDKRVWLFTIVLGFSAVAEIGISNWLVNFLQVSSGMNIDSSSFYLSAFFVIFTGGRLFGGFFAEKIGYMRIVIYFAAGIFIMFALGLALGSGWVLLFSVTGFFISVLYPTVITVLVREFKGNSTAVLGFVMTAAMGVSMICNWLIGKTSDIFGVRMGFASALIYIVLLVVSLFGLNSKLTVSELKLTGLWKNKHSARTE